MLLTNVERHRRKMTDSKVCSVCDGADETLFHRFRDCNASLSIWSCLNVRKPHTFFRSTNWNDWLSTNLAKVDYGEEDSLWHILFGVTLDQIWHNRNDLIFSQKRIPTQTSLIKIRNSVAAITSYISRSSRLHPSIPQHADTMIGNGQVLNSNMWCLSCDGAVGNKGRIAGCGGVLRTPTGDFSLAFSQHIDPCSALEAELWGVYYGIQLAHDKGIDNMVIEVDSSAVVELMLSRNFQGHALQQILRGIFNIGTVAEGFKWKKIDRDNNCLADIMAKQSLSISSGCIIYDSIPVFLIQAFNSVRIGLFGSSE